MRAASTRSTAPDFVANLRQEMLENVRRLRHRASLALWCGNNEMEWGWESWGWAEPPIDEEQMATLAKLAERARASAGCWRWRRKSQPLADWKELQDAYLQFFHTTLPAWVKEWDPDGIYWPSSPSSDTPFRNVNGQERGDAHYWDVWHGRKPFTAYRDQYPRFMSEFGFQALPPLPTVATYAGEADWNMTSYIMEHHQRSGSGNGLMLAQMTDNYRTAKDFPSLVYLSMMLQAEGIRYGVEHWRRNMDPAPPPAPPPPPPPPPPLPPFPPPQDARPAFPTTSTSVVGVSWTLAPHGVAVKQGEQPVSAAPLADTPVIELDFAAEVNVENQRDLIFVAELRQGDAVIATNVATFVPNKHLALRQPTLAASVTAQEGQLAIEVTSDTLARFVEVSLVGADAIFSDNYFDLPAGRSRTITTPLPAGWTAERAVQVRSLYDAFA